MPSLPADCVRMVMFPLLSGCCHVRHREPDLSGSASLQLASKRSATWNLVSSTLWWAIGTYPAHSLSLAESLPYSA
eukprot:358703-Chlamydomonas_euryale.AAC.1